MFKFIPRTIYKVSRSSRAIWRVVLLSFYLYFTHCNCQCIFTADFTSGRYFLVLFEFLEGVLMEHTDMKNSLDSRLQICSIFSIRICSRKQDIFKKLQHLNSNVKSACSLPRSPISSRRRGANNGAQSKHQNQITKN